MSMANDAVSEHPASTPPLNINALPVEILTDIFALVDSIDAWGSKGTIPGRGIAKLTLVCRHWRDVAHTTPEFWRHIDAVEPLETMSLFLKRSQECTIDVRIYYPAMNKHKPPSHDALALILPHAHRIRSLSVSLHMDDFPAVYPLLDAGMPALERLEAIPIRDGRGKRGDFERDYATCSISRRAFPRLRALGTQRLYMPALGDYWRTLRVLKMYDFPRTVERAFRMRDVLAVLKANPDLEELVLWWYMGSPKVAPADGSLRDTSQGNQGPSQLLALQKLRVFSIHGTLPWLTDLLNHLSLPEDIPYVDIRASASGAYTESPPIDNIMPPTGIVFLPAHLHFLQERMSGVSFTSIYPASYMLCTPPYAPADHELSPRRTAISVDGFHAPVPPRMSIGIRCLAGVLGTVPVRHLCLYGLPSPSDEDPYERMLDVFPFLEELEMSLWRYPTARPGADLFAALSPAQHPGELPRCPNLRTLSVHARVFVLSDMQEFAEAVAECTRARAVAGARLLKVVVHFWARLTSVSPGEVGDGSEGRDCLRPLEGMGDFVDEVELCYNPGGRVCERCTGGY